MPVVNISNEAELSGFLLSNDTNGLITNSISLSSVFNFLSDDMKVLSVLNSNCKLTRFI